MSVKLTSRNRPPVFVSIVHEEEELVSVFKDVLSQIHGIEVFGFTSSLLALEHFRENHEKYRVVISDSRMRGLNGFEMFEKMKDINPLPIRIIFSAFEYTKSAIKSCGCVDKFLLMPIAMDNLIAEVEKQIKSPILRRFRVLLSNSIRFISRTL